MTTVAIDCEKLQIVADSQTTCHFMRNDAVIAHTIHYKDDATKIHLIKENPNVWLVAAGNSKAIDDEVVEYKSTGSLRLKPTGSWTIAIVRRKDDHLHVDIHKSELVETR